MSSSRFFRSFRRWIVALVAFLAVLAVAIFALPKSAKACGGGSSYGGGSSGSDGLVIVGATLAIGVVVTDGILGAYDIGKGMSGDHVGKGYAIFETSFAGAQAAGVWLAISESQNTQWSPALVAIAAVPTLLTLHGVLTLATVDWSAEKPKEITPIDPRAVPYGVVPYAPYAPPPPPPPPAPDASSSHDGPSTPPPEDRLRIRFMPTMMPSGVPGNVSMAPGIAAWGVF
jgi:hypothetical protein